MQTPEVGLVTTGQVLTIGVLICLGLAIVAFGVHAWRRPRFLEGIRHVLTGLAPASILFGLQFLWLAANSVVAINSDYRESLSRWWFLPPGDGGALSGMLGNPATALMLLAILVLFWWPRDPRSPALFLRRLRDPDTRPSQLWFVGRGLSTFAAGIAIVIVCFALHVPGLLVIPLLWAGGLAAWWAFAKLIPRPQAPPGPPESTGSGDGDPRIPSPPRRNG